MAELVAEVIEIEPQEAIAVRGDVAPAELPEFFGHAFRDAAQAAAAAGVGIAGPPFGFYPRMPTETVEVEAGFPVSARPEAHGRAHRLLLPGGRAVQAMHVGPYDGLERTYDELASWMTERGLVPAAGMWESYLSDPETEPDPATWRTLITCPVS
ncbi:GyrI-like domain-containing protein [Nocardioides sp. GY 10113]|uniref:GyrI-like domain-containing protein n=1 Tax=Nocardioides sp. GY 10113 TaxID=2569761 RepID=UPI0010A7FCD6|nr:GyrI-like domain-containing protein [Nocardioides sp. GY 10113]TIC80476.1 GyrI-like domain-containing protein [Nocardioides sp. GY 10113]